MGNESIGELFRRIRNRELNFAETFWFAFFISCVLGFLNLGLFKINFSRYFGNLTSILLFDFWFIFLALLFMERIPHYFASMSAVCLAFTVVFGTVSGLYRYGVVHFNKMVLLNPALYISAAIGYIVYKVSYPIGLRLAKNYLEGRG